MQKTSPRGRLEAALCTSKALLAACAALLLGLRPAPALAAGGPAQLSSAPTQAATPPRESAPPTRGASASTQERPLVVAPADLVLIGGRVVTLDEALPESSGIAMRGDRIVRIGDEADLRPMIGEHTRVIDLKGMLAVPGLIEGHGHFLGIGDSAMQLDLKSARSWREIVALVAQAAREARPGELIRGRGWHQEKWSEAPAGALEGLPTHHSLSEVSPDNPVILVHASGHASFANKRAMSLCGIDAGTPDPEGGELVRDARGEPIGVFRESAADLLAAAYMGAREPEVARLAEFAQRECLRKGITSFQDAGTSMRRTLELAELVEAGSLQLRLWVMLRDSVESMEHGLASLESRRFGEHGMTIGGVKRAIDGALGSHGAWLLEPYADMPSSAGLNTSEIAEIEACASLCAREDLQMCVHAIGDRANRETLDLYERAFARYPEARAMRWRIEHAQHLDPRDVPRFAQLGVIASMQGVHCTSDAPWVLRRLGEERARSGAYLWRSLIDSGAVLTNGTDAPVEDVDPLPSFHASVARRLADGTRFFPEQCMTRMEALRSYTIQAAYAVFEEDIKGSLAVGKLADVTVFSQDILECPEEQILATRVAYTIVGGRVLYEAAR